MALAHTAPKQSVVPVPREPHSSGAISRVDTAGRSATRLQRAKVSPKHPPLAAARLAFFIIFAGPSAAWAAPTEGLGQLTFSELIQIGALIVAILTAAIVLVLLLGRRSNPERRLREALERNERIEQEATTAPEEVSESGSDGSNGAYQPAQADVISNIVPPVPSGLADALAHGSAFLIVGSAPSVREQAPTWKEFLGGLIDSEPVRIDRERSGTRGGSDSLRRLLKRNEVDAVVDLLDQRLGREALAGRARQAFASAAPSPWLERLCRLGWSGIVSTGVDGSMKRAAGAATVVTARSGTDFEQFFGTPDRFLLQLAGDLAKPETLSLTMGQLKEALLAAPDLRSLLSSMFGARTALFVGMSFQEIESLWDAVGLFGTPSSSHYALIDGDPDFDLIADRAASRYNVQLIEISEASALQSFVDALELEERRALALRAEPAGGPTQLDFVREVKLVNIGPFSNARVDLGAGWNVILGNNGAGKSTLLRAIALVLAGTDAQARPHARALLKRGEKSGSIEVTIDTVPQPSTYRAHLSLEGDRVTLTSSVSPLQAGLIPAFGFSAVRGVAGGPALESKPLNPQALPRVSDVLPLLESGIDGRAQDLRAWIRQNYAVSQDSAQPDDERARAHSKIISFFEIIDSMAPGFDLSFSRCDTLSGEILLNTTDGEIPLDYVSQGMSSMIGWAGTLIQRLFEINGDRENPAHSHAILLIDEIDSHLHPEWQQRLVPTLREKFPNLQVVATTHSALMVSSLEEQEVLKVSRDKAGLHIERLDKSYKGYRVDQILTDDAFDLASARGHSWEQLRSEYAALLGKTSRTPEEQRRYDELDEMLENAPPPFEARSERDSYFEARLSVDEAMTKAQPDQGRVQTADGKS